MNISARNAFRGTISAIRPGSINTEVEIALPGDDKIVAIVTNGSAQKMGLSVGKPVTALVKASSVLVMTNGDGMVLSARNVLSGKVSRLGNGQVNSEVAIALPGGSTVHATITHEAVTELGIKEGTDASAVFKASSVILGASV